MTNFKNVLKVFKAMRDFDSDDHALLNTLRNATEADIELLIEAVGPQKRATKKPASKGASKSRRAASLGEAIGSRSATLSARPCGYALNGGVCNAPEDSGIHDPAMGYRDYHEFQPTAVTAKDDHYEEQAAGAGGD